MAEILNRLPDALQTKVRQCVLGFQYLERDEDLLIKGYMDSNGERTGRWLEWSGGQLLCQQESQNGKLHGTTKLWYEDGQLRFHKEFQNGKEHGIWKWWYLSGQLSYQEEYQNGIRHGTWESWYPSGQLEYQEEYQNGKKTRWLEWYPNGQLRFQG